MPDYRELLKTPTSDRAAPYQGPRSFTPSRPEFYGGLSGPGGSPYMSGGMRAGPLDLSGGLALPVQGRPDYMARIKLLLGM